METSERDLESVWNETGDNSFCAPDLKFEKNPHNTKKSPMEYERQFRDHAAVTPLSFLISSEKHERTGYPGELFWRLAKDAFLWS